MAGSRGTRGTVMPSPLVILCIITVAVAGVAFFMTRGQGPDERQIATQSRQDTPATTTPTEEPERKKKKPVKRDEVEVAVFNNTSITGLAASAAADITAAGWNVVATDNWLGTVEETTVYYPSGLRRAAKLMALDFGIEKTAKAVGGMDTEMLTVVVTDALPTPAVD